MIYFDNSATTKPCRECVDAMTAALSEGWGNPSSRHTMGVDAYKTVTAARKQVLGALGVRVDTVKEENLVFCASGTEANNLAIIGVAHAKKSLRGGKLITSDAEHPSVHKPFAALEEEGFRCAYISTKRGVFDMEQFRREMTPETFLVSVMLVNNETGAVNDIRAISDYAKSVNPECIVHTDAVQGFLKVPCSPALLGADLITVSGHKIHASKGIGALYISPYLIKRKALSPVIFGGGHEAGLRSGTHNVPGIAGIGAASEAGALSFAEDMAHTAALRDYIAEKIATDDTLCSVGRNLPLSAQVAPHILSIRLPGIKSETMLNFLSGRGIAVSSGSACSSQSARISRALLNFGLTEKEADTTLRISLCADNTVGEADIFLDALRAGVQMLAKMKR